MSIFTGLPLRVPTSVTTSSPMAVADRNAINEWLRAIGGKVNPEQESWRAALIEFGYQAKICAGADELIGAVRDYMRAAPADDWYDEPLRAPERART